MVTDAADLKLPPHNLEAEEAVLGSLLIDDEAVDKVVGTLKAADFYREKNRWVYEACLELHKRREPINTITVAYELKRRQVLEALGGAAYLSHLVAQTPTSVHVAHYGAIVERLSMYRRMIQAANRIAAIAYEEPTDPAGALARAREALEQVHGGNGSATKYSGGYQTISGWVDIR